MRTLARILMLATISGSVFVLGTDAGRQKDEIDANETEHSHSHARGITKQANDAEGVDEEDAAGSSEQAGEQESRKGNEAGEEESSNADDPKGGINVSCGDIRLMTNWFRLHEGANQNMKDEMDGYEGKCDANEEKTLQGAQKNAQRLPGMKAQKQELDTRGEKARAQIKWQEEDDARYADRKAKEAAKSPQQKEEEKKAKEKIEQEQNKAMQQFCETIDDRNKEAPPDWTKFTSDVQDEDTIGDLQTPSPPQWVTDIVDCGLAHLGGLNSACAILRKTKVVEKFDTAAGLARWGCS